MTIGYSRCSSSGLTTVSFEVAFTSNTRVIVTCRDDDHAVNHVNIVETKECLLVFSTVIVGISTIFYA